MERIKEAIDKAGKQRDTSNHRSRIGTGQLAVIDSWHVKEVSLNPEVLENNRIVSFDQEHPNHVVFDVLRTKVLYEMQKHGFKTLAICSPTMGCGKTVVAINLAISIARQEGSKTALVDLDLRRPSVSKYLNIQADKPLGYYIEGGEDLQKCFFRVGDSLFFAVNTYRIKHAAEMMQHPRVTDIIPKTIAGLDPTIILFDLPPLLASDDSMVFLPEVDCALLIVEEGKTTAQQIEDSCQQFDSRTELLGIVLNKSDASQTENYQYKYP